MPLIFPVITRPAGHYEPARPAPATWVNRDIQFTMKFGTDATSQGILANPAVTIPIKLLGTYIDNADPNDPTQWVLLASKTWHGGVHNRAGALVEPSLSWGTSGDMPKQFKAVCDTDRSWDWGLDVVAT